jgi:hypothetical protein
MNRVRRPRPGCGPPFTSTTVPWMTAGCWAESRAMENSVATVGIGRRGMLLLPSVEAGRVRWRRVGGPQPGRLEKNRRRIDFF